MDIVQVHLCLEEHVGHIDLCPNLPLHTVCKNIIYAWEQMIIRYGVHIELLIIVDPMR